MFIARKSAVSTARWLAIAAVGALCCLMATQSSAKDVDEQPKIKTQVVDYKTTTNSKGQDVVLRLHLFMPPGWKASDKRSAVVFFFGGGWVGGSPGQFFPHCKDLAALGMVAASAEYRVQGKHGTTPQACVEDGKSAVRFLRANAQEMGIDPGRIVAAGGSAGGHVAACSGILTGYEAKGEDRKISSKPNLMILFNPVIDTASKTGYGAKKVGKNPERLSPLHQANKDQPPSLVLHGDKDTTVSIKSVRRFKEACGKLGVECVVAEYEGAGHGFFNHANFRKPKKGSPDYYKLTMQQAVGFLTKHGYLDAAEE